MNNNNQHTHFHHNHNHNQSSHLNNNHHILHQTPTTQPLPPPGSTLNCDDLDCFFCEQIATHIEHKRSAQNSINFDMESPTRKRGRFY